MVYGSSPYYLCNFHVNLKLFKNKVYLKDRSQIMPHLCSKPSSRSYLTLSPTLFLPYSALAKLASALILEHTKPCSLPQDLCTSYSLCLVCSYPDIFIARSLFHKGLHSNFILVKRPALITYLSLIHI